jgi:hypothetical protein
LVQEISFHMVKFFKFLVLYSYVTSWLGEKKKYHCGGHSWRGGLFTKQVKISDSHILLDCYGCIFHGTGNSAQLCQNFGFFFWGGGGFNTPNPPRYATAVNHTAVISSNYTTKMWVSKYAAEPKFLFVTSKLFLFLRCYIFKRESLLVYISFHR